MLHKLHDHFAQQRRHFVREALRYRLWLRTTPRHEEPWRQYLARQLTVCRERAEHFRRMYMETH